MDAAAEIGRTAEIGTTAEIGRNPVSKHQIQLECGERAGSRGAGRPNPSRETKFSGANGDREMFIFPVHLTTSRIGNLTRLIHTLLVEINKWTPPRKSEAIPRASSKHQIKSEHGKWAGCRGSGRLNPSRGTKFPGMNRDR